MNEIYYQCSFCNSHAWLIYGCVKHKGEKPILEIRSCPKCNEDGKNGLGVILYADSKDYNDYNSIENARKRHGENLNII